MFIAHLPAGYLASRALHRLYRGASIPVRRFVLAGTAGALAPDGDLLWFYLVDHGRHHHHAYPTHYPLLWIALLLLGLLANALKPAGAGLLLLVFVCNGLLHMGLDTVAGDIRWLAPFDDRAWSLVSVPAHYEPWWLNFVLHWTFLIELLITLAAAYMLRQSSARGSAGTAP